MRHVCCPRCRLRFTPAAAAYFTACPECSNSPEPIATLERTLGFRLVGPEDHSDAMSTNRGQNLERAATRTRARDVQNRRRQAPIRWAVGPLSDR